jgi:predicted component of type VI protein secretion system
MKQPKQTELMVDRFARAVKSATSVWPIFACCVNIRRLPEADAVTATSATVSSGPTLTKTALQQNLEFIEEITRELRSQPVPAFLRPAMEMGVASEFGNYPNTWIAQQLARKKAMKPLCAAPLCL